MFMQPQVYFGQYFSVETSAGTEIVPADVVGRTVGTAAKAFENYVQGTIQDPEEYLECLEGWLARMSAPGYMDCTDWSTYDSESEAWESLIDMYCDGDMYCEWLPASWEQALIGNYRIFDKKTSDALADWLADNFEKLDVESAQVVGESRVMSIPAWGTQDCKLFIFTSRLNKL